MLINSRTAPCNPSTKHGTSHWQRCTRCPEVFNIPVVYPGLDRRLAVSFGQTGWAIRAQLTPATKSIWFRDGSLIVNANENKGWVNWAAARAWLLRKSSCKLPMSEQRLVI